MKIKEKCIQMFYPLRCPVCDDIVTPYGEKICLECMPKLKLLTAPWCMKCGKKLSEEEEYCADCTRIHHNFIQGRALYEYSSVARSVYRLKYAKRQEYADFLGGEMARYLGDFIRQVQADALVPVPLHKKRQKKRGYNQSQLLATAISKYTRVPIEDKLIQRCKNTKPLKLQNPVERQNNLKKAFIIAKNDVKLKTIIIVDDIYTTGSTIDEMAAILKQAGVERIYYITLACGAGL